MARHAGDQSSVDILDVSFFYWFSGKFLFIYLNQELHILPFDMNGTFQRFAGLIEGIVENEPGTVEIKVTKSMTKQDVVDKILQEI